MVVEILQKFRDLSNEGDSQNIFDKLEPLKAEFYKNLNEGKEGADDEQLAQYATLEAEFKELYAKYKQERQDLYNEQERKKEEKAHLFWVPNMASTGKKKDRIPRAMAQ